MAFFLLIMSQKIKIFPFIQAVYYFITAVWPVVHIESFMNVTGQKTDIWLVKTVSVLLLPYCLLLVYLTFSNKRNFIIVLAMMICSIGLLVIDVYYYFSREIRWVYLIDGALQLIFFVCWMYYIVRAKEK